MHNYAKLIYEDIMPSGGGTLATQYNPIEQAYFFNQNAPSQATVVAGKLSFEFRSMSFLFRIPV